MNINGKIQSAKEKGFVYSGKDNNSVFLKHPKGHIISIDSGGNVEGVLKTEKPQIKEGKLRTGILLFMLIGLGMTYFTTDVTIVNGRSMEPTLQNMQVIIKSKFDPVKLLKSGSIIKFKDPSGSTCVKRISAMPGDTIKVDKTGFYINGKLVDPAIKYSVKKGQKNLSGEFDFNQIYDNPVEYTLEKDEYYVMGDNPVASVDSRTYGPISKSSILSIIFNDK